MHTKEQTYPLQHLNESQGLLQAAPTYPPKQLGLARKAKKEERGRNKGRDFRSARRESKKGEGDLGKGVRK